MSSGTVQLKAERLLLRRHRPEDADVLYHSFGLDTEMFKYTGWNPYADEQMAMKTVKRFIDNYEDDHFYGWAVEHEGKLIGTVGAYDLDPEIRSIEIGCSIERKSWGKGFAGEAVKEVIIYLTEHEDMHNVRAWCAADNIGSRKVMEKAGMECVSVESGALEIDGCKHDKMNYEY